MRRCYRSCFLGEGDSRLRSHPEAIGHVARCVLLLVLLADSVLELAGSNTDKPVLDLHLLSVPVDLRAVDVVRGERITMVDLVHQLVESEQVRLVVGDFFHASCDHLRVIDNHALSSI
mgnify:CR=1 FL=1